MKRTLVRPTETNADTTICSFQDGRVISARPAIAFCYDRRIDPIRLRQALARVLNDFSVYAGRLHYRAGSWCIEHGSGGVALEFAQSSESSRNLGALSKAQGKPFLCPPIALRPALRGRGPLLAARLTQTADGSVLGVTWLHALGDLQSIMLLLRAWALAYRDEAYEKPLLVADRDAYLTAHIPADSNHAQGLRRLSWSEIGAVSWYFVTHRSRRVDLEFSWSEIAAIRAAASRERTVSAQDALFAHVFSAIRRLQGRNPIARFVLGINYRKRLGLPANLVGNIVDLVVVEAEPSDDTATVAANLRSSIETFTSGPMAQHGLMKIKATRPGRYECMRYSPDFIDPKRSGGWLIMTSWAKFKIYDLVFETAPVFVSCFGESNSPLMWFGHTYESPDDAGLSMSLWLPPKLARGLERELARSIVPETNRSAGQAQQVRFVP